MIPGQSLRGPTLLRWNQHWVLALGSQSTAIQSLLAAHSPWHCSSVLISLWATPPETELSRNSSNNGGGQAVEATEV